MPQAWNLEEQVFEISSNIHLRRRTICILRFFLSLVSWAWQAHLRFCSGTQLIQIIPFQTLHSPNQVDALPSLSLPLASSSLASEGLWSKSGSWWFQMQDVWKLPKWELWQVKTDRRKPIALKPFSWHLFCSYFTCVEEASGLKVRKFEVNKMKNHDGSLLWP